MNKSTLITVVVIIGILILGGLYTFSIQKSAILSEKDTEASRTLTSTEESPYTDLEGNPFTFDTYRGQVRIVNSWASWCPFCVNELVDFEKLAEEFKDQGVAVIAINREEPRQRASSFLDKLADFTYMHFAMDLTDSYYISIGGFSMPETVFYDKEGNIIFHKRGVMTLDEMRTHTQDALSALSE